MNEEFYAIIKLVSGEEIFSKVCAFDENTEVLLVLDHPVFVQTIFSAKLNATVAKINPWINLTDETSFIINRDKIITMTECNDNTLIKMHKKYIKETTKSSNQTQISPNMGYVSSIAEARVSLEKLYNSNSEFKTQE